MSKALQFGCKKCGAVVGVEMKPWTDHIDVRIENGRVQDHFGELEILCKKCNKAVATVATEPV